MSSEESQPSDDQTAGTVLLDSDRLAENARPITSSLPPELFVQIISEVYRLIHHETPYDRRGINWSSPYQLVCRSWRDVIRSTPWIWGQWIRVTRSPEWLEVCLERCCSSWASVYVVPPYDPSATFSLLRHYASCIAICYIQSDAGNPTWLEGLSAFLATPLPLLESLRICAVWNEIADVSFTHDQLPELITLHLENCIPGPRDVAVYLSLRSLRLCATPWQISYTDFLDILRQCHDLQYLMLEGTLLDHFHETRMDRAMLPSSGRAPVFLPFLEILTLQGPREILFDLIDTLQMPLATTIDAETFVELAHPGPHISQFVSPDIQARHPLMCRPAAVSVTCLDNKFRLFLHGEKPGQGLSLAVYGRRLSSDWPAWSTYLEPNISAAVDMFSFDLVDTLHIDGVPEEVRAEVWHRVFQACRNLRVLHLRGWGTLHSVWQGMWDATLSSPPPDGVVCCPWLAEISVEGHPESPRHWQDFTATATLFETLRGALCARADQCGTRIEKLKMTLRYSHELWNGTAEHDAAVEEIRGLVNEFDYNNVLSDSYDPL
ncbi:hypothetical protein GSI_03341 [Ganoderma sinense ZZ0214-1]|uniref:Uncharacterized protein n=1 Tax=Ganoderma sinense ZZ0214-1 TaxID=1077348 RepID=A0A2G8SLE9_9APHY|nr:hypothetical protein GSI_03341 [Ganoderma sinense ZZ0214-1]